MAVYSLRRSLARALAAAAIAASGCGTPSRNYDGVAVTSVPVAHRGGRTELLRRCTEAVAVIETDVGRGLGFVIDPSGYVLTNRHVVEDANHIVRVILPGSRPPLEFESVHIEYIDPVRDLALLQVHTSEALPRVPLAAHGQQSLGSYVKRSDPVVVLRYRARDRVDGFDLRNGQVTTVGARNPAAGPGAFLGFSVDVERGQSGGPVLDRRGRVIGIVTWTWRDRAGGYAIPIGEASRMLAERPRLSSETERVSRAETRSRDFLNALGRGDVAKARRFTSPSRARSVREHTVDQILNGLDDGGSEAALQGFVAAVEDLVVEETDEGRFGRLQEIVARTGSSGFLDTLGVTGEVDAAQVVSFFYEVGQAYLAARVLGGEEPQDALRTAIRRLHTVEASRTFAIADLLADLEGNEIEIEAVEEVPGTYSPRVVVSLRATSVHPLARARAAAGVQSALASGETLSLHMRLEWGDWYVAAVGPLGFADEVEASPTLATAAGWSRRFPARPPAARVR